MPRRARTAWAVAAILLHGCVHAEAPTAPARARARVERAAPQRAAIADGGRDVADVTEVLEPSTPTDAGRPLLRVGVWPRPSAQCPVVTDSPERVVARVGRTRITACDVALEWHRRVRVGLRSDDPRALVAALVRDAALAARAPMPLPTDLALAETLRDALIRDEAVSSMDPVDLSDETLARFAEAHRTLFVRDPRVHARALAFSSREAAQAALEAIRRGDSLTTMLADSVAPYALRDQGDLGLVTPNTEALPAALRDVALALERDGDLSSEPIALEQRIARRRRRTTTRTTWWIVQRIERSGEEPMAEDAIRRRVAQRLLRERYRDALREASIRLRAEVAERARRAIDGSALNLVRVGPSR